MNILSAEVSAKFKFWSFVSMILLVFVHGFNMELRYLQPWTITNEPFTMTGFIEYFLANGLFRFRIPMLFIISGYLYALHDYKPNNQRIGKRSRTLLLPYLLWSAFGLLLIFAFELSPAGKEMVLKSGLMRLDDTRFYFSDYHWYEILARLFIVPVPF
jgi:fucose 4-O-acetylase-like acetyltransferase